MSCLLMTDRITVTMASAFAFTSKDMNAVEFSLLFTSGGVRCEARFINRHCHAIDHVLGVVRRVLLEHAVSLHVYVWPASPLFRHSVSILALAGLSFFTCCMQ